MKQGWAHTHVRRRPHKGIRDGVDQLTRNAKVTDLDFTLRVEEDVRRLDICEAASVPSPHGGVDTEVSLELIDGTRRLDLP